MCSSTVSTKSNISSWPCITNQSTLTLHSASLCSECEPLSDQDSKIPQCWAQVPSLSEKRDQPLNMNIDTDEK